MNLLLDAHALIWFLEDDARLSADARSAITNPGNRSLVSDATVWEIGIKHALSGIRAEADFERVRQSLQAFPDEVITTEIHELAASFFNTCRSQGVQGSHTDFLICACAVAWKMQIFAKDGDYGHYERIIPIQILTIE
jgi:hypothetical protein